MLIYWGLFILILFCFFLVGEKSKYINVVFFILIICEILIGGLRNLSVGTDTAHYIEIFQSITSDNCLNLDSYAFVTNRDSLFWIVYGYIYLFFKGYTILFFIHSLIHWLFVYFSIKDIASNCFLAILVFISFRYSDLHLSGMRQGLSLAIVMFSFRYVIKRDLLKFCCLVLLAMLIHKSSLIFLPVYWIYQLDIKRIPNFLIVMMIGVFFLFKSFLYNNIFILLLQNDAYELYLNTNEEHGILYYTLYVVSFLFCYMFYNKEDCVSRKLLLLTLIGVLMQTITLENPIFNRVSIYFSLFFVFLIPRIYSYNCKVHGKQIPTLFVTSFLLCLYTLGGAAPGIVPYKFFWE